MFRLLLCLMLLGSPAALASSVESLSDPRPAHQVLDLTGTLYPADIGRIDELSRGNGELMVVVLDSLGGENPRLFTQRLFNRLRLDSGHRNRGVLFLVALKDRAAEIVVGDGYPSSVTSQTDAIMSGTVVPGFKRRNAREAILSGAEELSRRVLNGTTVAPGPSPSASRVAPGPSPSASRRTVREPPPRVSPTFSLSWIFGGAGLVALVGLGTRALLRRRPRKCPQCASQMVRLDETADDEHLSVPERQEEMVGSVDYDVWLCEGCSHTEKLRYGALFTRFSKCRQCQAITLKTTSRTLVAPTEHSGGQAEVMERCENCSFDHTYIRYIRRLPSSSKRSRRIYSSGFISSGGSSSSSSSGSSSGSGGSSSGRGSSGSW